MTNKKPILQPVKFGLALGIVWGVTLFITTLFSTWTNYGMDFLTMFQAMYPGFSITIPGAFIGAIYGFVDLFILGFVLIWLYNKLTK